MRDIRQREDGFARAPARYDLFVIAYPGHPRLLYDIAMTGTRVALCPDARQRSSRPDFERSRRSIVARLGVRDNMVTVIPLATTV